MEYSKLQSELIAAIPEIQRSYNELREDWTPDPIPNHIVFESMFVPFVEERISAGADSTVRSAFSLIEAMAQSEDAETKNLVYVAFFEGREAGFLNRWLPYSGQSTRTLVEQYDAKQTTG